MNKIKEKPAVKICLISSEGGHLNQLLKLKNFYSEYDHFFMVEKTNLSLQLLKNESVYFLKLTNRKSILFIFELIVNTFLSIKYLLIEKPHIIISTGALSTIPMGILGKLSGKKIIFIESFSKVKGATLTGKCFYRISDLFIIQREELKKFYKNAVYGGELL